MENIMPENPSAQAEIAVKDFVRFLPEAKRDAYELMLRRCNFHDPDDPLFPILLFLLFFQESVSESVDRINASIAEMKSVPPKSVKKENSRFPLRIFHILLIALTAAALLLCGIALSRRDFLPREKADVSEERMPQRELKEINRYWTKKLAEKPEERQEEFQNGKLFMMITAAGAAAAWLPVIIVLIQWKRISRRLRKKPCFPRRRH